MELQLWLMKHLCEKCGGTLAPIAGYEQDTAAAAVHECNSCGVKRPDKVFDAMIRMEMDAAGGGGDEYDSDDSEDDDEEDALPSPSDSAAEYDDVD